MQKIVTVITKEENEIDLFEHISGDIPEWTEYIAVDDDGAIFAYPEEPIKKNGYFSCTEMNYESIGRISGVSHVSNWDDLVFKYSVKKDALDIGTIVIIDLGKLVFKFKNNNFAPGKIIVVKDEGTDGYKYTGEFVYKNDKTSRFYFDPEHIVFACDPDNGNQLEIL